MTGFIKSRSKLSSFAISLLTILFPGLGHMFAGRIRRGLIFLLGIIAFLAVSALTGLMHSLFGVAVTYLVIILTWVYMVIDVYCLNRHKKGINLKCYNKWYFYILFAVISNFLINFSGASWGYRHYRVVTNTSVPVLKKGDAVLAVAFGSALLNCILEEKILLFNCLAFTMNL